MLKSKSAPEGGDVASDEKTGGRVVVLLLLGLLLLAGAAYVAVHQVAGYKVPRGPAGSGGRRRR